MAPMAMAMLATPAMAAGPLTADDYCDVKISRPASVKDMTPLVDGESYAAISDDGKCIEAFSYLTGKKISTLFDVDKVKGDVQMGNFEGFTISDNGKKILLWNDSEKIYRHSFTAEYYVYDIMRNTLKQVSKDGAQRGAVLSHDGLKVAYTRDNNLFIANLDYGTDKQITKDGAINKIIYGVPDWGYEEEFGVENTIRWSADDNMLAYVRFDESNVPTYSFDDVKSFCSPDPTSDLYPKTYSYKYPLAGYNNSVVSVYAYDLNNTMAKKMDLPIGERDYVPSLEFDGNGKQLMVMILNRDQNHLQLYRVNPGSTVAHRILEEKSNAWLSPAAYQMVTYKPDYFVIGSERSGYRHLYKYNYSGTLLKQLTSGDFNVTAYYGCDTSKGVHYMQTTKLGAINRNLAAVSEKSGFTLLNTEPGTATAWFSKNFKYYLRSYSNALTPPEYAIYTADGRRKVEVENNATYAAKYAGAPKMEFVKVPNAAGEEMDGYIIKPADFDPNKKYPLVTYQYNGPDSQEVLNKWKMDGLNYIASEGYIVACVDGRGTGNRSRAWANAVYKQLGTYEVADQVAGAKYFASLPYVDAERVGCFGWSYGGYMTLMQLTEIGSPWKCGISMAPVTDWRYYDSIYTERYMLTPQQNEDGYQKASAMWRSENLHGDLLIMSGTSDDNVHFYNTLKFTSKLTSEGKLFDMMAYTGFEHSLRMCNARAMLYRKAVKFYNSHLK